PLPHQLANRSQAHLLAPLAKLSFVAETHEVLSAISRWYSPLEGRYPRVTHPSATPSRLRERAFDLHVLGTPPAFILSQDQTRHSNGAFFICTRPTRERDMIVTLSAQEPSSCTVIISAIWALGKVPDSDSALTGN